MVWFLLTQSEPERVITNHLRTFSEVIGQLMCLDQEQQEYKIQEVLCSELFENMDNLYSFYGWLQTHTDLCTSTVPCHIPECKAYLAMGRCLAQTCNVHLSSSKLNHVHTINKLL